MQQSYRLIKYSDTALRGTYQYFWTVDSKICSPYFKSEELANNWAKKKGILKDE